MSFHRRIGLAPAWPRYESDEISAVVRVLRSGRVNYWTGQEGRQFEEEFADLAGTRHAIALANGTVALDLALYGARIGARNGGREDDEVIVTPRSFVASAATVANAGAVPVFADVDRDSQNITPQTVAPLISPRTRAIICVHLAGWPCDMDGFRALVAGRDIVLIEDCAQAHGARYRGRPVGGLGDIAAWSFCQDKIITTGGEGGMVTCNDSALWERMWSYKDHGRSWAATCERRHPPGFRWLIEEFGTNWRMTEMQAAIGRRQLTKLEAWNAARTRNAGILARAISEFAGEDGVVRLPWLETADGSRHAFYRFYAFLRPERMAPGWTLDRFVAEVAECGVPIQHGPCPEIYREVAFRKAGFGPPQRLPVARELGETNFMLPVHPTLSNAELGHMAEVLARTLRRAAGKDGQTAMSAIGRGIGTARWADPIARGRPARDAARNTTLRAPGDDRAARSAARPQAAVQIGHAEPKRAGQTGGIGLMRVVITGAAGLIGWHAHARLHARNCAARFRGAPEPFEIVALDRAAFCDDARLRDAVTGADAVLHFAGVNRGPDDEVAAANPAIARRLAQACAQAGAAPHVVYANSVHAGADNAYGRSKAEAAEILAGIGGGFANLVLPHIFGEGARPFYNNVTATLIHHLLAGSAPQINPAGRVCLLHAGAAAEAAISAACDRATGDLVLQGREMGVPELHARLREMHEAYRGSTIPDLGDDFDVALFNSYRAATYPQGWPRPLKLNADARGVLFEAVRGGGGGQTFVSTTHPGITRGDHFHLGKVERFLVVQGEAIIRIRRVLGGEVWSFPVSGDEPAAVDMPTLHTHSIENVGTGPLVTLFWAHEPFDPARPDTYADPVLP